MCWSKRSLDKDIDLVFWGRILSPSTRTELREMIIRREQEARLNMIEYYDQAPSNDATDWKGLFKDNRQIILGELGESNRN